MFLIFKFYYTLYYVIKTTPILVITTFPILLVITVIFINFHFLFHWVLNIILVFDYCFNININQYSLNLFPVTLLSSVKMPKQYTYYINRHMVFFTNIYKCRKFYKTPDVKIM